MNYCVLVIKLLELLGDEQWSLPLRHVGMEEAKTNVFCPLFKCVLLSSSFVLSVSMPDSLFVCLSACGLDITVEAD